MSAVARGTAYELHVVRVLQQLGIRARRRGGAGDGGIDLVGKWTPVQGPDLQILVQCKYYSKPLGPQTIRELLASLEHWAPRTARPMALATAGAAEAAVAFIVCSSGLTSSAKR